MLTTVTRRGVLGFASLSLASVLEAGTALADVAFANRPPGFTPDEIRVIAADQRLMKVLEKDPWRLRRVFDAINGDIAINDGSEIAATDHAGNAPLASPEAANDLFQIIKKSKETLNK